MNSHEVRFLERLLCGALVYKFGAVVRHACIRAASETAVKGYPTSCSRLAMTIASCASLSSGPQIRLGPLLFRRPGERALGNIGVAPYVPLRHNCLRRQFLHRLRQMLRRQMGVAQCHRQVGVSQQFTDRVEVDSRHDQAAGEVVTQVVEAEPRDPGSLQ